MYPLFLTINIYMSKGMVKYLRNIDGVENLRDFQHASRLYLSNEYDFVPKAGWIYYVELKINSDIGNVISDPQVKLDFQQWYDQYKGQIGLLAKSVDMPKFTIDTEIVNQYNKKTVVQKGINYGSVGLTFHDDMSNVTTNLWKSYYQYYYGDSIDFINKYRIGKYDNYSEKRNFRFGLNNEQTKPFFSSIVVYQLYQKKFTKFEIINPLIKSWSHDSLDQNSSDKMLSSRMDVDYETLVYDTGNDNLVTQTEPGFNDSGRYDNVGSPNKIKADVAESLNAQHGRKSDIFGKLKNPRPSPLSGLNNTPPNQKRILSPARSTSTSNNPSPSTSITKDGILISQHSSQSSPVNISISTRNTTNVTETRSSNAYRPRSRGDT